MILTQIFTSELLETLFIGKKNREFCNRLMQSWLQDNDIEFSTKEENLLLLKDSSEL